MYDDEEKSPYHVASQFAGLAKQNIDLLRKEDLKQLWRNYLLGVTMVRDGSINRFISAHLYPQGNTYQAEHSKVFEGLLSEDTRFSFLPVTYEHFIDTATL
jgi:hypothetical protein